MNVLTIANRKFLAASILVISFLLGLALIHVQAATNDSSISLKKDKSTGLFVLTIRDPDGILEFSMTPTGKLPYSGGLSGCKTSFINNNTVFNESSDFNPAMLARVVDCKNNTTELEIPPPVDGITRSVVVRKEELPPPPLPSPAPAQEAKEVKKEGPLSAEDIEFPAPELGNCQSENECRSYCDVVDHAKECFGFAKKYHLISEEEAKKAADHFLNVKNGPGGCNSGKSCEDYCNTTDHLDECIDFADKTGYYSPEQLAEARKFQALVKAGAQFPGGCKDRNTCELYCNESGHMEECLDFAEKSGFLPKDEIDQARKILPLMKSGKTPGKCTSREQCDKYCAADEHLDECIAFADKAGLLSGEEKEMIKKTGGKGPGGCRSKAQCDTYCQTNSEECFRFAEEHGLIDEKDLQQMREGMARFKESLDKMPPEAVECMKDAAGEENFNKMLAGEPVFDRSLEGKMKSCFSQVTAQVSQQLNALPPEAVECIKDTIGEEGLKKLQSGEPDENIDFSSLEKCFQQLQASFGGGAGGSGRGSGGGGFAGPGGCKSIDECTAYCQSNPDECKNFAPPGGGGPGGSGGPGGFPGGPGGCASQEECTTYCQDHPDECKDFGPPSGGGGGGGGGGSGGGFGGPGDCQSPEECRAYCTAHYTDPACAPYVSGGGGSGGGPVGGGGTGNGGTSGGGGGSGGGPAQQYQQQFQQQGEMCPEYVSVTECPADQERFLSHDSPGCQLYSCRPKQQQYQTPESGGSGGGTGILITPEICANFKDVPACSYVGSPDSQNYQLCAQCYPYKTNPPTSKANILDKLLGVVFAPFIELLNH
jgi:hypothetical protein